MAYSALAVANEFIYLASRNALSPMKLQKLVYFAHGWHLALHDAALVEEPIEAWQFGPVISDLYREFRAYGDAPIRTPAKKRERLTHVEYEPRVSDPDPERRERALNVIASVWTAYGDYSATKLSNATHKEGSPWSQIYIPERHSLIIPNDLIQSYFKAL